MNEENCTLMDRVRIPRFVQETMGAFAFCEKSFRLFMLLLIPVLCWLLAPCEVHAFSGMAGNGSVMGRSEGVHRHDAINRLIEKEYRIFEDGSWSMRLHFVTQVLTFNGLKENSDFRFQYNPAFEEVKVVLARTTTAHGRVVEVNPKEINDITDPASAAAALFASSRVKVVSFPAVDLGSSVELVLEKRSRLPFWAVESFRLNDPTLFKRVTVDLPERAELRYHLEAEGVVFERKPLEGEPGYVRYSWSARDLVPVKQEPRRPPIVNSGHCLILSSYSSWADALKPIRDELVRAALPLDADLFDLPDDPDGIFQALQDRLKVFRLPLLKSRISFQTPGQCLKSAMGTQFDACLLFKAILEKKGFEDVSILLAGSDGAVLDGLDDIPALGLLDTALVVCQGRFYSFDSRNIPPGVTDMAGQRAYDVLQDEWLTIIDRPSAQRSAAWQVEIQGPDLAQVHYFRMDSGAESRTLRAIFKDLTPEEFDLRRRMFLFSLSPSVKEGGHLWVFGEDELSPSVVARADFEMGSPLVELRDGTLLYPIRFGQVLQEIGGMSRRRENPFFIRQGVAARFVLDLIVPPGWSVESLPQAGRGTQGLLTWSVTSRRSGRHIYVSALFEIRRGLLPPGGEYERFRDSVGRLLDPARWVVALRKD